MSKYFPMHSDLKYCYTFLKTRIQISSVAGKIIDFQLNGG
jgi:hypothetical protein